MVVAGVVLVGRLLDPCLLPQIACMRPPAALLWLDSNNGWHDNSRGAPGEVILRHSRLVLARKYILLATSSTTEDPARRRAFYGRSAKGKRLNKPLRPGAPGCRALRFS